MKLILSRCYIKAFWYSRTNRQEQTNKCPCLPHTRTGNMRVNLIKWSKKPQVSSTLPSLASAVMLSSCLKQLCMLLFLSVSIRSRILVFQQSVYDIVVWFNKSCHRLLRQHLKILSACGMTQKQVMHLDVSTYFCCALLSDWQVKDMLQTDFWYLWCVALTIV